MKRRHFIASTGVLTTGLLDIRLFKQAKQIPQGFQQLMEKFNKELNSSLLAHDTPIADTGLTTIRKVLSHHESKGHAHFYYKSGSNDRVLLIRKKNQDIIFINPENPKKYFALA